MNLTPLFRTTAPRRALHFLILLILLATASCRERHTVYPVLPVEGGEVKVDLAGIGNTDGRFFTYLSSSGRNVDYFVYRDSSGEARAVLDACRTCYRWRKGYRLGGDHVVCLKCDMRFSLDSLAEGMGSCVPIRVPSEVRGDTLVIRSADLEEGSRYF